MPTAQYPPNTGPHADLSEEEKKKRLDVMVRIWRSDTERRIEREHMLRSRRHARTKASPETN